MPTQTQEVILDYIKDNEPIEQSRIVETFQYIWGYNSKSSARNAISQILKRLEHQDLIKKQKLDSGKFLQKNVWRIIYG